MLLDEQYGWFGKELRAAILQVMVHHADQLAESGGCMRAVATLPGHVQWSDIATANGGGGQMGSSLHSVGCWPPSAERGTIAPREYRHVELDITPGRVSVLVTPDMAMPPPTDECMLQVLSADLSPADLRRACTERAFQRAERALRQAATDGKLQPADLQSLLPLVPPPTFSAAQALWHATARLQLEGDLDGGESLWADTPSKFDEIRRSVGLEPEELPGVWFASDLPGAISHGLTYHAAELRGCIRAFALLKGHTQVPHVSATMVDATRAAGVCMEDVRLWPPTVVEAGTTVYPRTADPACRHVELIISLREVGEAEVRVLPGLPPMAGEGVAGAASAGGPTAEEEADTMATAGDAGAGVGAEAGAETEAQHATRGEGWQSGGTGSVAAAAATEAMTTDAAALAATDTAAAAATGVDMDVD